MSNPDLAGGRDNELTPVKFVRVFLKHGIEMLDFGLQVSTREPKENDALMNKPLVKNQLAEVAVGNEQNALLAPGDCQDIFISKTMGIIAGDGRNVMAKLAKVDNQPEIGALVE
jgi:hypothetical protein